MPETTVTTPSYTTPWDTIGVLSQTLVCARAELLTMNRGAAAFTILFH